MVFGADHLNPWNAEPGCPVDATEDPKKIRSAASEAALLIKLLIEFLPSLVVPP